MAWPPEVGEPLPRGGDAWYEPAKLARWVLGEEGHGAEWARVMQVGSEDVEKVWEAISAQAAEGRVTGLRDLGRFGLCCEVQGRLAIGGRAATCRTIWHYAAPDAAPRLVSAFPKP